jgi:hypothetical protein
VLGIESDGLFTFAEQQELAEGLPNGRLEKITSPEGHDGFLLEFDQVNRHIMGFMREVLPEIMDSEGDGEKGEELKAVKTSMFGEAEVEVRLYFWVMLLIGRISLHGRSTEVMDSIYDWCENALYYHRGRKWEEDWSI